MSRSPLLALIPLILVAGTACAPGLELDADPRHSARAINVINDFSHPMIVWFDDGTGERLLGTVAASSTDRFILDGAGAATVSVIARDEARTHTVRRTVALAPGGFVDVRLD